jgi:hypothetical protein
MANALYPKWKEALLQASSNSALNGSGTTGVYAALVDTGTYTYSASHQFYSDLSGIASTTDQEVGATKTYTNGVFDGADITWPSVAGPVSYEAIVLYVKNAGANTTWRLVAYIDTGVTNLPVTSNGGNIGVTFNASGIFGL